MKEASERAVQRLPFVLLALVLLLIVLVVLLVLLLILLLIALLILLLVLIVLIHVNCSFEKYARKSGARIREHRF